MFDLNCDSIAHIIKDKPFINPKSHRFLTHHFNIHTTIIQENTQQ